jgi:dolichyl-phosphate-mannose--protein O-mannosyl transferase
LYGRNLLRFPSVGHIDLTRVFSLWLVDPLGFDSVTCGSSIKLVHDMTRFRLHSHEIAYGSGSGQQSVTAHASRNDPNSYWLVKEGDGEAACELGTKIQCGATIRLEHVATRRNLHTHAFRAPLSPQHEVSGFGVAGDGDAGDNWIVDCVETHQCSADGKCDDQGVWKRDALVKLRSAITGRLLTTSWRERFDDSNCPRCPINGQQQVSATTEDNEYAFWFAGEGIYVSPH